MQGLPIQFSANGALVKGKSLDENSLLKSDVSPGEKAESTNDFLTLFSQVSNGVKEGSESSSSLQFASSNGSDNQQNFSSEEKALKPNLELFNSKQANPNSAVSKATSVLNEMLQGTENTSLGESTKKDSIKVTTGEDFVKNLELANSKSSSLKNIDPKLTLLPGGAAVVNLPNGKQPAQAIKSYGKSHNVLADNVIRNSKDIAFKDKKVSSELDEILKPELKVASELSLIKQDVMPIEALKGEAKNELQPSVQNKVLDLSKIDTANTSEIIKKISDYVEQNQIANKQNLDLTVRHEALGEFKIQVSKTHHSLNQIDMQITSSSREGHDFFVKNEVSLIKNLNQAGIQLSDLRIVSNVAESGTWGHSDSRQSSSFQQDSNGSSRQYMNFESQSFNADADNGAQKRKLLWQEYQERYGA